MTTSRIALGSPAMFTALVAEAAMSLPPLTKPEHFALLKEVLALTMEGFWQRYAQKLPQDARDQLVTAIDGKSMEAVTEWCALYADFKNDAAAAERGEKILAELAAELPGILKEAYAEECTPS